MAPTVLLECTKRKELKHRESRDLSFAMMGKSQKFPRGNSSGFVPDYRHAAAENEEEGFGSSGRVDSEGSCTPKRKCISLNNDKRRGTCNIPSQVISLAKMSDLERRELETRLRGELEQVRALQKRINSRAVTSASGLAVSASSNGHVKKREPVSHNGAQSRSHNGSQSRHGSAGRFESAKPVQPPPSVSNSDAILLKQCEQVLKRVMSHQYAWVFNKPVDTVKLNIPDYHTVIKHPMDLGTIKTKIASGAYSSPRFFAADVRLTFTNAMTYNPPGNDVHFMADVLNKFFEARWKPLEKKLAVADVRAKQEFEPVTRLPDSAPRPVQRPVQQPMSQSMSQSKQSMSQSKKRKDPPANHEVIMPARVKQRMTVEEKQSLSRRLEASLTDLPEHIIDFLRGHGDNANQTGDDEIEIDIDSLADDTLFELRRLLDAYLLEKQSKQAKVGPCEMEVLNDSGISNSSMHPCKDNEPPDEDVDIGGNDPPISSYPPVEIEKDTAPRSSKCSSSSSSSSGSGSSSSDSDSGSSSGSDSDDSPQKAAKANVGREATVAEEKSDIMNPGDTNRSVSGMDQQAGRNNPVSMELDGRQEGENAPSERQVSPEKLYRAALMRNRFADTILKAREKTLQNEKGDPEKIRREKEELERRLREDKARLQAEAKAAEEARRRAEAEAAAEAAAEAKRKLDLEREAARQALLQMEKTVEINENSVILKELEMFQGVPLDHVPNTVDENSPDQSLDGIGGFKLGGPNPLEQLGLFMKVDDDDEEYAEPSSFPTHDVEEGEID